MKIACGENDITVNYSYMQFLKIDNRQIYKAEQEAGYVIREKPIELSKKDMTV